MGVAGVVARRAVLCSATGCARYTVSLGMGAPVLTGVILLAALGLPAPVLSQTLVPVLDGVWVYANPDAARKGDIYQWRSVRVEITQKGSDIRGDYHCVYAVPDGERFNPEVRFRFEGRIVSDVMEFPLAAPLKGYIRIRKTADAELRVSYLVENSKKQGISFGRVADNDPQTLRRRLD